MKGLILFLLNFINLLLHISNADKCDCGTFGTDAQNNRIYNGKTSREDRYPWQIFLLIDTDNENGNDKFSYDCGGSLISRRHILTAAHCFFDLVTKMWVSNECFDV